MLSQSIKNGPKEEEGSESSNIVMNEVQLVLAEKRTSLAAMRTRIAVFVLPLFVLSILVATSKYYDFIHVMHFIIPLLIICAALVFLGSYLIVSSIGRIHHHDQLILNIKRKHSQDCRASGLRSPFGYRRPLNDAHTPRRR